MLLAYFPNTNTSIYTLYAANRLKGTATLEIPENLRSQYMETYVFFIAANHKQVSNSVYTGSLNK